MTEEGVLILDFVLEENPSLLAKAEAVWLASQVMPFIAARELLLSVDNPDVYSDEAAALRETFTSLVALIDEPKGRLEVGGFWENVELDKDEISHEFNALSCGDKDYPGHLYHQAVQIIVRSFEEDLTELYEAFANKHDGLSVFITSDSYRIGRYV